MRMRLSQSELQRTSTGMHVGAYFFTYKLLIVNDSIFEAELQDVIPICHATIAGTRIVGRLTAGYLFRALATLIAIKDKD